MKEADPAGEAKPTPPAGHSEAADRAALGLIALQLFLHALAVAGEWDRRVLLPHAVAWLHDVAILAALALTTKVVLRITPVRARPALSVAGLLATLAGGALLSVSPQMLRDFLASPVNFLQADWGTAKVFLREYAGLDVLWPVPIALVVGGVCSRLKRLRLPRLRALIALPVGALMLLTILRQSPNPVVFGLQETFTQLFVRRAVPRLKTALAGGGSAVTPARAFLDPTAATRYDRVLFVVLESVTAADFEREFLDRRGGFFERHRSRARYFARHHATNLDSYPALLAMMTSVQVPFMAYADPQRYEAVNDEPNLAQSLRACGFRTLFVSTYEHQPFVPNLHDWDHLSDRRDLGDLSGWTSVGGRRMEEAVEDRAALATIVQFVASSPRTFVLSELVFGHSPEWRARTGMTPVEYYDRYLTDLWARLAAAGLTSRTLLVVVSDHGDRSAASQPDNYRVPLLVVGDGIDPGRDDAFRSHLDLQAIVAHFLQGCPMPEPRREILLVGSTERWIYGTVRDDGGYLFIDDNTGRVLAGALDPASVHAGFQAYVDSFSSSHVRR